MRYREDYCSGNQLSVLGFGCMRLPRTAIGQIDLDKSQAMVVAAVEQGVNYFDTAYNYFGSEQALGIILEKNNLRQRVYLATKLPHQKCSDISDVQRIFAEQLAHLKTDYIDYYLIHNIGSLKQWRRLLALGIEQWIEERKATGQIRRIGFSFHGTQADFMELLNCYDWEFCQIQYNYLNIDYQAGRAGLKRAYDYGLPVMVMEPLLGGRLSNRLPKKALRLLTAAQPNLSPAGWALRWIWDQAEPTVVLSGISEMGQLEENVALACGSYPGMLSTEEHTLIGQAAALITESYKLPCTGCNYCMPCPQGVNIPGCFAAYNLSYAMGMVLGMQLYIIGTRANNSAGNAQAQNCNACGSCVDKCPQQIAIPQQLQLLRKRLEPWWFGGLLRLLQRFG